MATLINISNFVGQNNIPDKDMVGTNVQSFIDKYQSMFLTELFGVDLYNAYKGSPDKERFANLMDNIKPALVDYVYWFYLEDESIQNLGTGAAQSKKQNAVSVSAMPKMVRAWNEMVDINLKTREYIVDNETVYPEFVPTMSYLPEYVWQLPFVQCHQRRIDIFTYRNSLGI